MQTYNFPSPPAYSEIKKGGISSMNRTTKYKLCQFEASDQVQRTDFNEDNAKIDAALSGHAACPAASPP